MFFVLLILFPLVGASAGAEECFQGLMSPTLKRALTVPVRLNVSQQIGNWRESVSGVVSLAKAVEVAGLLSPGQVATISGLNPIQGPPRGVFRVQLDSVLQDAVLFGEGTLTPDVMGRETESLEVVYDEIRLSDGGEPSVFPSEEEKEASENERISFPSLSIFKGLEAMGPTDWLRVSHPALPLVPVPLPDLRESMSPHF